MGHDVTEIAKKIDPGKTLFQIVSALVVLLSLWPVGAQAQLNLRGVDDADSCFIENSKAINSRESWAAIREACRMRFPFRFLRNKEYEFDCVSYSLRFDTRNNIITLLSNESPVERPITRFSQDELVFANGWRMTSNGMLITSDGKSFQCYRKGVMG